MLASPSALSLRLAFFAGSDDGAVPLIFAHLAFWAARILALPAGLTFHFFTGTSVDWAGVGTSPPRISFNSPCSDWIFSWMSAALRNAFGDRIVIEFIVKQLRLDSIRL